MGDILNDWRRVQAGDIPPVTLEERVRETYGQSRNDQIQFILEKRANDLIYGEGAEVEILYGGERTKKVKEARPGDTTAVTQKKVPVIDTDPELGTPIGLRVKQTGDRSSVPAGDILIEHDSDLQEKVSQVVEQRQNLLRDIRDSGEKLSYGARLEPGGKTTRAGYLGNLRDEYGKDNVKEIGDDEDHVVVLRKGQPPALADVRGGWAGLEIADTADISGDIGESAAALGGHAVAQYLTRRGGRGLGKTATTGLGGAIDTAAAVGRQLVSGQLPGEDYPGQSVGESLPERAGQALVTGLGGVVGDVAAKKVLGPLAKRVRLLAGQRYAHRLAKAKQEEVANLTSGKKVGEFLAESQEVEKEIGELAGRQTSMSLGQATGEEAALVQEFSIAGKTGKGRTEIIKQQKKRLEDGATALDALTAMVAKDPEMLGDGAVSQQLADSSKQYINSIETLRSTRAVPLYEQVEKTTGNLFTAKPVTDQAFQIIEDYGRFDGVQGKMQKAIKFLNSRKAKNGRLSIQSLNQERRKWSLIAAGKGKVSRDMSPAENVAAGARMLSAIDDSMDQAAKQYSTTAGAASEALQAANHIWSTYTREIDNFMGRTKGSRKLGLAAKVMGLSEAGDDAAVIAALDRAPPKQVGAMLTAIEKLPAGAGTAQQVRARLMQRSFETAGHYRHDDPLGVGERVSKTMAPKELADAIERRGELFSELFKKQPQMRNKLKAITRFYDRIAQGPQVPGSQTAPGWADMKIVDEVSRRGLIESLSEKGQRFAGALIKRSLQAGDMVAFSTEEIARLASTTEGVNSMYALASAQANPFRARAVEKGARALAHMVTILSREDILEEDDQ